MMDHVRSMVIGAPCKLRHCLLRTAMLAYSSKGYTMKLTLFATVVGISETDTSGYGGGAHAVTFDIGGPAPMGLVPRKVTMPLFGADHTRELGALYARPSAVRVTFETGENDATDDIRSAAPIVCDLDGAGVCKRCGKDSMSGGSEACSRRVPR